MYGTCSWLYIDESVMLEASVAAEARMAKLMKVQKEVIPDRGFLLNRTKCRNVHRPGRYTKVPTNTVMCQLSVLAK